MLIMYWKTRKCNILNYLIFVLRKYVNNQERYISDINKMASINDYNKLAIRQGFISESYRIVDGKPEPLISENEMVSTQALPLQRICNEKKSLHFCCLHDIILSKVCLSILNISKSSL